MKDVLAALRTKANISVVGIEDHFDIFNSPALRTTHFVILDDLHGPTGYGLYVPPPQHRFMDTVEQRLPPQP